MYLLPNSIYQLQYRYMFWNTRHNGKLNNLEKRITFIEAVLINGIKITEI